VLIATALLLCAGCNKGPSDLGLVEGQVLMDGKPLNNIQVTFTPDTGQGTYGPNSSAITDENGHFKLICEDKKRKPGAVIGNHRVTLVDMGAAPTSSEDSHSSNQKKMLKQDQGNKKQNPLKPDLAGQREKPRLGSSYSDPSNTPLKKEVKAGSQTIDIEASATGTQGGGGPPAGGGGRRGGR
jgi:hypothetical protein